MVNQPYQNHSNQWSVDEVVIAEETAVYTITLLGHFTPEWTSWMQMLNILHNDNGTTTISGQVSDQAALHGVLTQIRDRGLVILSLHRNKN